MSVEPPSVFSYEILDEQSIELVWISVFHVASYDVKVSGFSETMSTEKPEIKINGLLPLHEYNISIRSVYPGGNKSEWNSIAVQTSFGRPASTQGPYDVFDPISSYNNTLIFELPDLNGDIQSCTLRLVWHESDRGWWADLDVPTGTPAISGRRLGLNCGLLDDIDGVLNGNIVMRSTTQNDLSEPGRDCFKEHTHELRWEPNQ